MAQWAKCLLCKLEDLNLDPQFKNKNKNQTKLLWLHRPIILALETESGRPEGLASHRV